jgi:hypothetical protein
VPRRRVVLPVPTAKASHLHSEELTPNAGRGVARAPRVAGRDHLSPGGCPPETAKRAWEGLVCGLSRRCDDDIAARIRWRALRSGGTAHYQTRQLEPPYILDDAGEALTDASSATTKLRTRVMRDQRPGAMVRWDGSGELVSRTRDPCLPIQEFIQEIAVASHAPVRMCRVESLPHKGCAPVPTPA